MRIVCRCVRPLLAACCVASFLAGPTADKALAETRVSVATPQPNPLRGRASPAPANPAARRTLQTAVSLGDIGFGSGLRFANLGGRREVFVPVPQGADIVPASITLTLDDMSAHPARRSLEVLVNDRTAAAIVLDGHSEGRVVRVPLAAAKPRDGFVKLGFVYSGAATPDRCIDVRSIGDSLTVRAESALEIDVGPGALDDVANVLALMPRQVAIVLAPRRLAPTDAAAALTVGRALSASGRQVAYFRGFNNLPERIAEGESRRWDRGLVVIGALADAADYVEPAPARIAGVPPQLGALAAVQIGGAPALLVSEADAVRAASLIGSKSVAATRGVALATVGPTARLAAPADRVTFDQLGLAPALAEVFGRADLSVAVNARQLPPGTRMSRLQLDVMVAPDGAGEKAVVSALVNERLMASTVAAIGEPTRLDIAIPDGLVGNVANIRLVVQRRSAQGDCRFEPQGYPAQILGSSAIVLSDAIATPHDFSDLTARFTDGVEVLLSDATDPTANLTLLTDILATLSADGAPITARFVADGAAPSAQAPFIAVGAQPPAGSQPRVRFDHGRVAVTDRGGRTLLDIGGLARGAVGQIVMAGAHPGLWIHPLAGDGVLPTPASLRLDRGDVAFFDQLGTKLAISTERDTLVRIAYPDQVSWLSVAEQFRPWLIGGLWAFATIGFLVLLQRLLRRRARNSGA